MIDQLFDMNQYSISSGLVIFQILYSLGFKTRQPTELDPRSRMFKSKDILNFTGIYPTSFHTKITPFVIGRDMSAPEMQLPEDNENSIRFNKKLKKRNTMSKARYQNFKTAKGKMNVEWSEPSREIVITHRIDVGSILSDKSVLFGERLDAPTISGKKVQNKTGKNNRKTGKVNSKKEREYEWESTDESVDESEQEQEPEMRDVNEDENNKHNKERTKKERNRKEDGEYNENQKDDNESLEKSEEQPSAATCQCTCSYTNNSKLFTQKVSCGEQYVHPTFYINDPIPDGDATVTQSVRREGSYNEFQRNEEEFNEKYDRRWQWGWGGQWPFQPKWPFNNNLGWTGTGDLADDWIGYGGWGWPYYDEWDRKGRRCSANKLMNYFCKLQASTLNGLITLKTCSCTSFSSTRDGFKSEIKLSYKDKYLQNLCAPVNRMQRFVEALKTDSPYQVSTPPSKVEDNTPSIYSNLLQQLLSSLIRPDSFQVSTNQNISDVVVNPVTSLYPQDVKTDVQKPVISAKPLIPQQIADMYSPL